jgi:hypothetical protein
VNRSGGCSATLVGDTKEPEGVADRLPSAPWERLSIAKIGRHAGHNARLAQRVARRSQANGVPLMQDRTSLPHLEPRWHASLAVLAAVALYITLPPRLTIGPVWIAPLLVLLVLVPLSILAPRRHKETRRARFWSILLIAIVNFFNLVSVLLLIASFFHPEKTSAHTAGPLLRTGAQIWLTNILVFALWFWELDGNGPASRAHAGPETELKNADFLFPQMQMAVIAGRGASGTDSFWKPQFLDYLYLAFTNSTAFSPADVMPLSRWAKVLMTLEAMISLITIAIVLARSVGLIQ